MIDILADFNNDDRRSTFSCDAYDVCKALKDVSIRLNVDEVFVVAGAGKITLRGLPLVPFLVKRGGGRVVLMMGWWAPLSVLLLLRTGAAIGAIAVFFGGVAPVSLPAEVLALFADVVIAVTMVGATASKATSGISSRGHGRRCS